MNGERKLKRYWLWVWVPWGKVKSGWDFDTKEDAENYFYRHFMSNSDGPVKHEITYEASVR